MYHIAFAEDGRNGLHTQFVHFALEESTVHHFVTDVGIEQGKDVQRLHHIRTIGTGKRDEGLQMYVPLQGTDAPCHSLVGQVLALAVGIQYGQEQGCELVPVGYATEGNSGFFAIFQQGKAKGVAIGFQNLHIEMGGCALKVVQELYQLLAFLSSGRMVDAKCIVGFQSAEDVGNLLENGGI